MLKKYFILPLLLIINVALGQTPDEYTLTVSARISNQGSGPGFKEWKDYPTRTLATLNSYKPLKKIKTDEFGGRTDRKVKATGFYYVTKVGNRWWSVDPDGNLFINVGLNDVNMGASENNKSAFSAMYKGEQDWAYLTTQMLRNLGFNAAGAWSNYKVLNGSAGKIQPLAYTVILNFMGTYGKGKGTYQQSGHLGYPDNAIFVFDPEFESFCDSYARQLTANVSDRNLYGYFSDNELPFYRKSLDNFLSKKDTTDNGYRAARKWLTDHHIERSAITDQNRNEFLGFVVDKYLGTVAQAIKKYDPNHMFMGCRFNGYEKTVKEVIQSAGKHLDLITFNYYNQWTPKASDMENWTNWSGKPFIITEWYVKGEDSGMGNYSGAGWEVKTQQARGQFYQNYALGLLESGNCVGWHWFKYQDNDPSNKKVDPSNADANKGIVNNHYELYNGLSDKMKELNTQVYQLADFFDSRKRK